MAFIQATAVPLGKTRAVATQSTTPRRSPTMKAQPTSYTRRSMLQLAASSLAVLTGVSAAHAAATARKDDDFSLQDLKADVEKLSYEEEVTDVGPDDREKNPTRTKRKKEEPEYRIEEKELVEQDDASFDAMVAKEKDEAEKLKKEFSK